MDLYRVPLNAIPVIVLLLPQKSFPLWARFSVCAGLSVVVAVALGRLRCLAAESSLREEGMFLNEEEVEPTAKGEQLDSSSTTANDQSSVTSSGSAANFYGSVV